MTDIVSIGTDLGMSDTQAPRAANILSVQFGSLEYAQELGIDLAYFLGEEFTFQNESFKSYLVSTLANMGINVSTVDETLEDLFSRYVFNLVPTEQNTGLVR